MASEAAPAPQAQTPVSTIGRLAGVLFSPKATFEDIARKPSWLAPLIALVLISLAITYFFGARVGWRGFMQKQDANSSRFQQLPPDQQARLLDQQTKIAPIIGYVGVGVGTFVVPLVIAGIFLGIFNVTTGAQFDFKSSLGVVTHSWMPYFVSGVLGLVVLFLKSPDTIDLQHLVASNPGALLSDDAPKWLDTLLTSLDLFTIWSMVLMALGFSTLRPKKLKMGRALALIVVVWLAYVCVRTGISAAFS